MAQPSLAAQYEALLAFFAGAGQRLFRPPRPLAPAEAWGLLDRSGAASVTGNSEQGEQSPLMRVLQQMSNVGADAAAQPASDLDDLLDRVQEAL